VRRPASNEEAVIDNHSTLEPNAYLLLLGGPSQGDGIPLPIWNPLAE